MMALFSYFPLPSITHPRAGSQVWWRSQCGSSLSVQTEPEVNSRRLNTMANNDDIRYCHRFSYVFLKFLLFFYSIVFWVSWTVSVGQSAACRGGLCVAMFLWAGDGGRVGGGFRTEMGCTAPANLLGAVSKWSKARISFPRPVLWFAALKRQVLSPVEEWNVCVNDVTTPFTPHLYVTELAW